MDKNKPIRYEICDKCKGKKDQDGKEITRKGYLPAGI
jgi:uncharacterized protein YlaI